VRESLADPFGDWGVDRYIGTRRAVTKGSASGRRRNVGRMSVVIVTTAAVVVPTAQERGGVSYHGNDPTVAVPREKWRIVVPTPRPQENPPAQTEDTGRSPESRTSSNTAKPVEAGEPEHPPVQRRKPFQGTPTRQKGAPVDRYDDEPGPVRQPLLRRAPAPRAYTPDTPPPQTDESWREARHREHSVDVPEPSRVRPYTTRRDRGDSARRDSSRRESSDPRRRGELEDEFLQRRERDRVQRLAALRSRVSPGEMEPELRSVDVGRHSEERRSAALSGRRGTTSNGWSSSSNGEALTEYGNESGFGPARADDRDSRSDHGRR
jgi:hypothetical protein